MTSIITLTLPLYVILSLYFRSLESITHLDSLCLVASIPNKDADYVTKLSYYSPSEVLLHPKPLRKSSEVNHNDIDKDKDKAKEDTSSNIMPIYQSRSSRMIRFDRHTSISVSKDKNKNKSHLSQMSFKEKVNYERANESKRELIKLQMKGIKEEMAGLYKDYEAQIKIYDNLKLEIDILNNFKSHFKKENSITYKGIKKGINDNSNNNSNNNNNGNSFIEKKNTYYQKLLNQANRLKLNREQKEMSLIGISIEKKKIKERITELNERLTNMRLEYDDINKTLYIYYHKLLSEGLDCRKDGLIWIIKKIWNMGGNVLVSSFPLFLDSRVIDFLFNLATKSVHIDSIRRQIEVIKERDNHNNNNKRQEAMRQANANANDNNHDKDKSKGTLSEPQLNSKQKLKANYSFAISRNKAILASKDSERVSNSISSTISLFNATSSNPTLNSSLKYLSNASQQNILMQLNQLSKEEQKRASNKNMKTRSAELQSLEEYYIRLSKEINAMRRKELNRINKEYYMNDYGRRYNVKQEIVIATIIGQELVNIETKKAKMEQKEYFRIMSILKKKVQIPSELQYFLSESESNLK